MVLLAMRFDVLKENALLTALIFHIPFSVEDIPTHALSYLPTYICQFLLTVSLAAISLAAIGDQKPNSMLN
ncbi:uncharacterized protein EI97DRAFT_437341 [Westerdykella ornata]|uniref:Uncharacterized protein n=1 Tax=Westerdykella ornata TaxID=318751 RepID=A0A6A6J5U7_WESOR|nr:uncharacterized protein EI97DRAFT_437341 [Westerdykella ornata]KAF2271960.1 hypothetical protein EI97DRAFT_437341 [Westerdykella ornata]